MIHRIAVAALVSALAVACGGAASSTSGTGNQADTTQVSQWCGGGSWLDVPSFNGIDGTYARAGAAASVDTVRTMSFSDVTTATRTNGTYVRTLESGASDTGTFDALADNPAFETNIMLTPAGSSQPRDMFYVLGVRRDASDEITAICMEHMVSQHQADPVIVLERVEDAGAPEAGADDAGNDDAGDADAGPALDEPDAG